MQYQHLTPAERTIDRQVYEICRDDETREALTDLQANDEIDCMLSAGLFNGADASAVRASLRRLGIGKFAAIDATGRYFHTVANGYILTTLYAQEAFKVPTRADANELLEALIDSDSDSGWKVSAL